MKKVFITSDPEVIKLFSYSTQLSMELILLINVKMPTNVFILLINVKMPQCWHFNIYWQDKHNMSELQSNNLISLFFII